MIGMTVCSGIGAPEVSAPWIDWRYQSEIDPFPRAGQDEAIEAGLHMAADGPRYKALGNSWATNCGEWIFDRIRMVEGLG